MKKLLTILFLLTCVATCHGQNRWVAKTGNDSNTGTKASPYLTISKAISTTFDTLYPIAGTYDEYIDKLSFGTGEKQLIITAPPQLLHITFNGASFILKDDENVFSVELNNFKATITQQDWNNPVSVYYNTSVTSYTTKNDCPAGYTGSREYYTVVEKLYSSLISQVDAQNKAKADALRNKQLWANHKGVCTK
jgi:hypothetical protein